MLAGSYEKGGSKYCKNPDSFLGVGNTECLHENLLTAVFLLAVIVLVSIGVEKLIHFIRSSIKCPQLRKIVNRIFEEVLILGFLSMVIFTLNTSGAMTSLAFNDLTASEKLHFYEFFHYIVFLTMIYFIAIVLLLLFTGTVVPKLVWEIKKQPNKRRESISDIEHDDTYDTQYPSLAGNSTYCASMGHRVHSFIRHYSSLNRGSYPGNTADCLFDGEGCTSDRPSGDYYLSMRARYCSDGDSVHRRFGGRPRALSGMNLVMGSRAYSLLLQRYQREGCCFHWNIRKQWHLWKSFEVLAYNICENRSGYIYKNPIEMERLFGIQASPQARWRAFQNAIGVPAESGVDCEDDENVMTFARFHVLCMRNLLLHMTHIHPSGFLILIVICLLPSIYPEEDHWIFLGVGGLLLLMNVVICFKVLKILRGIVDDRLHIISMQEIQSRVSVQGPTYNRAGDEPASAEISTAGNLAEDNATILQTRPKQAPKRKSFKAVALAIRAMIRMQMSALSHLQLHYHDDRFWFKSPKLLLRLFQFATIGQAFYLVWFSLIETESMTSDPQFSDGSGTGLLILTVIFPVLSLLVITPLTMPSLVLVMSLTGIFEELNASNGGEEENHHTVTQEEVTKHTRTMRRLYLKSYYTKGKNLSPPPELPPLRTAHRFDVADPTPDQENGMGSQTSMFLRICDTPEAHAEKGSHDFPDDNNFPGRNSTLGSSRIHGRASGGESEYRSSNTFNLAAFQSLGSGHTTDAHGTENYYVDSHPYQSGSSFTSTTSSNGKRSPRPNRIEINMPAPQRKWSQANAGPVVSIGGNAAVDDIMEEGTYKQAQSPVAGSFKPHCSKYGGYPES
ncbi:hypothetical protein PsorP6_008936 [Peronosclerospora sorghi]|uniref:Uncharacterized protein n=1 Tax=Peronosclerospora sorghi TaxID=230839 RepID=A0ACC0W041_9STRA|nr:hypothetical protein PsorP6_008936 [Peronosclerospora sorghi]